MPLFDKEVEIEEKLDKAKKKKKAPSGKPFFLTPVPQEVKEVAAERALEAEAAQQEPAPQPQAKQAPKMPISPVAPTQEKKKEEGGNKGLLSFAFSQFAPLAIGGLIDGDAGAAAAFDKSQDVLKGLREAEQQQKDNKFREEESEARRKQQMELQERQFAQQDKRDARLLGNKITLASMKDAPKTTQQKLQDLGGEEKKRLDNITQAQNALNVLTQEVNAGASRFSVIGDNTYTFQRNLFAEAIGRMQSGGAINAEEGERFINLLPGVMDSDEIAREKLQTLKEMMQTRMATLGFTPEELGFQSQEAQAAQDAALMEALQQRGIK